MIKNEENSSSDYQEEGQILTPSTTDHPLYENIIEACKTVFDPEIPVNIYDLGLIYTIVINKTNDVKILMSLTAPGCPVAGEMPGWVSDAIKPVANVNNIEVELVWEPQWGMEMMSDEARLELGFM
jgi:FeS assembly SUF system protein